MPLSQTFRRVDPGSIFPRARRPARQATQPLLDLALAPETASFIATAVVNAATFTGGIATGDLISIFGSGLASAAGSTPVGVGAAAATVLSASPLQVNAALPATLAPGAIGCA